MDPVQLDRALALVRFLRANCAWDAAQTPASLIPYLLEEAHETSEAITAGNDAELKSELGDLLLNIAFQIVLAEERGAFTGEEVVAHLEAKMRRRHPHLYGDGPPQKWEELKARERAAADSEATLLSGLSRSLDPLSRAHRIQERVSTVGFDWADAVGAFDKVAEELAEVREAMSTLGREDSKTNESALEEELGDLLFAVVNLTRLAGMHSLQALQRANQKFTRRFDALELLARERGVELGKATLEELDRLWGDVKRKESLQ